MCKVARLHHLITITDTKERTTKSTVGIKSWLELVSFSAQVPVKKKLNVVASDELVRKFTGDKNGTGNIVNLIIYFINFVEVSCAEFKID